MNHKRAAALAAQIVSFWQKRGYEVAAWVEREPYSKEAQSAGHTVRTNLVNGLPMNYRPSLIADLAARPTLDF